MIPTRGSNPEVNVVYIGAYILKALSCNKMKITSIIRLGEEDLSVSVDHIVLTLDWLYIIRAIEYRNDFVFISNANSNEYEA